MPRMVALLCVMLNLVLFVEKLFRSFYAHLHLRKLTRKSPHRYCNLNKVDKMFHKNEIKPIGERLLELNDFAGFEVLKMKEYQVLEAAQ